MNRPLTNSALGWFWLALCLAAMRASAQNDTYAIDWFTIDGGGGISTGGGYSVSGTIGQPDAGLLTGGAFSLQGGFWGVVTASRPALSIRRSGSAVIISWPAPSTGFRLQENPDLGTTGWTYVATSPVLVGSENQVTVISPVGKRFYRLRNP
jgi:hypothetical protein